MAKRKKKATSSSSSRVQAASASPPGSPLLAKSSESLEVDDELKAMIVIAYNIANDVIAKGNGEDLFSGDVDLSDFIGEQYDCSRTNISESFINFLEKYDLDKDNLIDKDEFSKGLSDGLFGPLASDLVMQDNSVVKRLSTLADMCSTLCPENIIDASGFSFVVRILKLALLLKNVQFPPQLDDWGDAATKVASTCADRFGMISFFPDKISWSFRPHSNYTAWDETFFFTNARKELDEHKQQKRLIENALEWTVLHNNWGLRDILKLSVMQQMHPLMTEDLVRLETEAPKYQRSAAQDDDSPTFFFIVPLKRLSKATVELMESLEPKIGCSTQSFRARSYSTAKTEGDGDANFQAKARAPIQIESATLGVVLIQKEKSDNIITLHTSWVQDSRGKNSMLREDGGNKTPPSSILPKSSLSGDLMKPLLHSKSVYAQDRNAESLGSIFEGSVFSRALLRNLRSARSKLRRLRSGSWLIFEIIDACIDELYPIVEVYRSKLTAMQRLLREGTSAKTLFSIQDVRRLQAVKSELEELISDLRPFTRVLEQLQRDKDWTKGDSMSMNFMEDALSALLAIVEDLKRSKETCDAIMEEFRDVRDNRMNDILFLLTIVTTIMVPAQFLTGLFGMNFEFEGALQDPLLTSKYGYKIFWILTIALTFLVLGLFWCMGLLSRKK